MRQKIIIGVPYNENGEELQKKVRVDFISNDVLRRYTRIAEDLSDAVDLQAEFNLKEELMGELITDPDKTLKEKRTEARILKIQQTEIKKKIKAGNHGQIMKDRFSVIETILKDNGNTDPELLNIDFWDKKTDPATVWKFLGMAVTKDMSQGKKKVNTSSMKTS